MFIAIIYEKIRIAFVFLFFIRMKLIKILFIIHENNIIIFYLNEKLSASFAHYLYSTPISSHKLFYKPL